MRLIARALAAVLGFLAGVAAIAVDVADWTFDTLCRGRDRLHELGAPDRPELER